MKREKLLKIVITLIMGTVLFVMSTDVFAADSGIDFFEDTTNQLDTNTNTSSDTNTSTNTNTNTSTDTNTNTSTSTNTSVDTNTNSSTNTTGTIDMNTTTNTSTNANNYNTNLPKAGAPENAILGVVMTVLVVVAVFAYRKVNQYKNI